MSTIDSKTKSAILQKASECQGWSTDAQLSLMFDLLQQCVKVEGDILEIGSAWGRSAVMLGLSSPKTLWSIDPHTGGLHYIRKNENQDSYAIFVENLKKNNLTEKTRVLKCTTSEAAAQKLMPENVKLAFVYIDGLHTAEGVAIDIDYVMPRLSSGAVVVFDDYFVPGVVDMKEMIDKKAADHGLKLILNENARLAYFIAK